MQQAKQVTEENQNLEKSPTTNLIQLFQLDGSTLGEYFKGHRIKSVSNENNILVKGLGRPRKTSL